MLFAALCYDKPGALDLRLATRAEHLAFLDKYAAQVKLGGPFLDDADKPVGSLLILDCVDETAARALEGAATPRIHTFIATSDIHLEHKLRKSRAEVLQIAGEMVAYARSLVDDVEFSCEDATRSDPAFVARVCREAIRAGASTRAVSQREGGRAIRRNEKSDMTEIRATRA